MKVCSTCHKPNADDSKFCMFCGEVLGDSPAPAPAPTKSAEPSPSAPAPTPIAASPTPSPVSAPASEAPVSTPASAGPAPASVPVAHSESSLPQNTSQSPVQSVASGIMNQAKSVNLPDISKVSSKVDTTKALSFVQSNKKLLAALAALIIVLVCVLMYFSQSRGSLKHFEDVYGNDCPYFDTRVVIHPDMVIPKGSEVYVITQLQRSGKSGPENVVNIECAKVNGDNEIIANCPMGLSGSPVALYKDVAGNLYLINGDIGWVGSEDSEKRSEFIEDMVKAQTALTPDPSKIADYQEKQVDFNTKLQERILDGDLKAPEKGLMEVWAEADEITDSSAKKAGRINLSEFGSRNNAMSIHKTLKPEDIDRTFSFK